MAVPALNIKYPDLGNVLAKGAYIKRQEAALQGQQAQNALTQQKLADYPEDRNFLRESRERQKTQWGQQEEDRARTIEKEDIATNRQKLEDAAKILGNVTNQKEWIDGLDMYAQIYGDEDLKGFPLKYSKETVEQLRNLVGKELEKITYDMQTIYGPKGKTARISVPKGSNYVPPKGWSLTKPSEKGPRETKLTPAEKKQSEAKMKEYGNNLAIIKAYKTGYDPMGFGMKVTEEDYKQAVERNKELDEWFGKLGIDKGSREDLLNDAIKIAQDMQKNPKIDNETPEYGTIRHPMPNRGQQSSAKGSWRDYQ